MDARYLFPADYMADPAAHVFNGRLYIYPSHDRDAGIPEQDDGSHFDMVDYHALSIDGDPMTAPVTDHGVILDLKGVPWAKRQLWDSDVAVRDGQYRLYFCAKDKDDVFRIGVALADRPEGPFVAEPEPIAGSYSIDPCVFTDADGAQYIVEGPGMERLLDSVNFEDLESMNWFHRTLKRWGVIDALREAGAGEGSTVVIGDMEFDFVE